MRQQWWISLALVGSLAMAGCSGSALSEGGDSGEDVAAPGTAEAETGGDATNGDDGDGGEGESGGTITVGLINPTTGPFAALGEDVNAGFELYVDENGGQLAGYDVEILREDTANDTAVAIEGVERLLSDGADVMLGFVNSGVTYGASEFVRESGVPLIITTAGADNLTQRDAAENIFRVSYTSSQDSMPLGDYACNELGYETTAIIGLDYAFGWEAASGFAKAYEDAGCEIVQELYAPLGTQDWAPFVQQLDKSADAVWAVIAGSDAIRFTRAYSDFGVDLPLLGHGSTTDEQVLEEQAAFAEGAITSLHYSGAFESEHNVAFREAFESTTGRSVSQYAEHGYATAQVIEAALEAAGSSDADALVEAIGDVQVDAPRGPLSFDEYGQAVYRVYVREVAQDDEGRWVNRVIEQYDDVSQFWNYDPEEFMAGEPLDELRGTWAG
jgi:branched-chain amino acid transport system substrate-binding protein